MDRSKYWAALPTEEVGKEIMAKVEAYGEYLKDSGIMAELRKSYRTYYGDSAVREAGVQGELAVMKVNHYASLIRGISSMVTANRPAWEPRATNTDVKSQAQCILAAGLLDFYAREKRMERYLKNALNVALFQREGWISVTWNATAGDAYAPDPETGGMVKEGDIEYKLHRLNDVIRDYDKDDNDFDWLAIREYKNKHDLAAKYPEFADQITSLKVDTRDLENFRLRPFNSRKDNDLVAIYTFYHEKTDAIPEGRAVVLLNDEIVLFDGSLPYKKIPLYRVAAEDMVETAFGHSPAFDLLPLQTGLDTIFSTILSNQKSFGVQNIMVPKGSDIGVNQLAGGMNVVEYDPKLGPPQALNLTQTPAEIFNFAELLRSSQETLSGFNAVARGNASPQLSGAAMALLQSTALQFSSGVQQSYTQIVEDVGTATIHILGDPNFVRTQRVAHIIGKHNRSMIKEFQADDLGGISRVTVDSANALGKSIAGRTEIANQLLSQGLIKRPEQYLAVLQTGQLDPIYENETSEIMLIRSENERLSDGQPVIAVLTDDHALHILEHKSVLASPESREDQGIVQATLDHIQEHMNQLQTLPPILAQLMQQPPMPPPPPAPGIPEVTNAQPPIEQAGDVPMPNMPTNPLTGETFTPNGQQ